MTISLNGKVTVPESVLVRELAGDSVLLNLESESYFGLDEVGTRMWSALTTAPSIDAACERLLAEYNVEPVRLRADLNDFAHKMVQLGLLHVATD